MSKQQKVYNNNKGDYAMIQTHKLNKHYDSIKAVNDVSFTLNPGEILGFIGPNGAGKSTTIKLLLNQIFPDSGSLTILGMDPNSNAISIKEQVGYVPSEVNFFPNFTVMQIIELVLKAHSIKDHSYSDELCHLFQMETDKKIKNLSLGNKKKVALICALVIKPKILIMDEPTNGLDPLVQKTLFTLLKQLVKQGVSVLISSHNMSEIQEHCDRVMFIKKGKIIKTMTNKEYQLAGKYVKATGSIKELIPLADKILKQSDHSIAMIYTGPIDNLLNLLIKMELSDLVIEDVSIEHQFLEYYTDEVTS